MKKLISKFKSKPSDDLYVYVQLWYTLDSYLVTRIGAYIFFRFNKWDVEKFNLIKDKELSMTNKRQLKEIYEYDYKVFKVLLFLYWDLEYYLEGTDYVKNTLKSNLENRVMLDTILKYDVYSKTICLDRHKKAAYIKEYKLYKKYNDKISIGFIYYIRKVQANNAQIESSYYENYIDMLYQEWKSEINKDLTKKYKEKIKVIDLELKILIESLRNKMV